MEKFQQCLALILSAIISLCIVVVAFLCFVALPVFASARQSVSSYIGATWGWYAAIVLVLVFVFALPHIWKAHVAKERHRREEELHQERLAHIKATRNLALQAPALGFNYSYHNTFTNEKVEFSNPYVGKSARTTVREVDTEPEQQKIEMPKEAISAVVRYEDVAYQIPANQSLLGIHPENGTLELVDFERYKTVWFVGGSDTGKTNTVYGKVQEAVERINAQLIICDPHMFKVDSLSNKLKGFTPRFMRPIAQKSDAIVESLEGFKQEFMNRLRGSDCSQKILLVVDEVNHLNRDERVRKLLKEIVFICGEEARGFGMYGYFISQKAAHLKWLRDSALTIIVHALLQESEAELAANGDAKLAKQVMRFQKGRTLIYGYDFDPMVLQQPLYQIGVPLQTPTSPIDENVTYFTQAVKRREAERDTEKVPAQKKNTEDARIDAVLDLMLAGTSVNQIIKEQWGIASSGGGAYQAALVELREIQKIIAQRAKVV